MNIIKDYIFEENNLNFSKIEDIIAESSGPSIDLSDLYMQYTTVESWTCEDGIVKSGSQHIDSGYGIRSISNEKTGFSYGNNFNFSEIIKAAKLSKSIIKSNSSQSLKLKEYSDFEKLYISESPLASVTDDQKVSFLREINKYIKGKDKRVQQVIINLSSSFDSVFVANSLGTYCFDDRPLVRFNVMVILKSGERVERGSAGGGGRYTYPVLLDTKRPYELADEAIRIADVNLTSKPCKAGNTTVVLGSGWPGVLLHEAVGHGLEGDFNRKKTSNFSDLIGQKVASDLCTVIDDGTIKDRRGSLSIDDEGTPTAKNTLIENGVLKGYMQDLMNARLMNVKPTGNGRRESYAHLPMPRMTNTYMLGGTSDANEIIESVKDGIYAVNFSGGQVDITSGQFVFTASEAYKIESGKVKHAIKGMTLIGNGPDVLKKVSMVANDMKLDDGVGTCGKEGQSVPVGVGQPTLKIDDITVGGTEV
ncbi:metalloprotease TldD [Gammaproteobacteria bacterium]|nr:metalloprotease TldD [Gammaproteobacteria bacterium]